MSLPSPDQFLNRPASSPADGLAFDRATRRERPHCKSRREAVEATLNAVRATIAETVALKQKLAASRQKIAALGAARISNQRLKAELSLSKNRLEKLKAAPAKTSLLSIYNSMPNGQPKRDFLAKHAVAIQTLSKTNR